MSVISARVDNILRGRSAKSGKSAEDRPPNLREVIRVSSALSLFLTSRLSCHRQPLLSVDAQKGCRCGHDLLKVLVSAAAAVTKACLGGTQDSDDIANAKVVSRDCVVCLHHVWSSDPSEFVRALSESPVAQRKYIWLTRQLDREEVRAAIGMRSEEGRRSQ